MKINKTQDYARFQMAIENRDVRKIGRLYKSMKEYGWLPSFPATVVPMRGGKLLLKDGQNRFEVAKQLKLPVLYVCLDEHQDFSIAKVNIAQTPWNTSDYLASFSKQGNEDYLQVKEYCERTGISVMQTVAMMAGNVASTGSNHSQIFKEGLFKVKSVTLPTTVENIVLHLRQHIPWSSDKGLVCAISRACCVKDFSPKVFKDKVDSNPGMLRKQATTDDYSKMLEEIYNYRAHCPIPLKFLCDQEMRRRNPSVNGNGK